MFDNPIDQNPPELGGAASQIDPCLLDPAWPDMEVWGRAGVRGGIGPAPKPTATLPDGSDTEAIQTAIDRTAAAGGGTVLLSPGTHRFDHPLYLRSGVVLRGAYVDAVKLEIRLRGTFPGFTHPRVPLLESAIRMDHVERAGLEHVTVVFDPSTPRITGVRHMENPFSDRAHGPDEDLFVNSIWIHRSRDCFVQFCRVVDSGSNPLVIRECEHITARACELHGAHMRTGGQAYLRVSGSRHCLLAGLVLRDLRHLCIMDGTGAHPCRHNVVIDCDLEVDINFHSGDSGHNLIQDCRIVVPGWHWWGPFALGVKDVHQPPGPDNLVYRCHAERRRLATLARTRMVENPRVVYRLRDSFDNGLPLFTEAGPAPAHGTLYPVRDKKKTPP